MELSRLRAWWWHRQGRDGSLRNATPSDVLARAGWARSIGGVGPYLTLFARARTSRAAADDAVARLSIHELPAARGCTYVLPQTDFALGLTLAYAFGDAEMNVARKLGVTEQEVEALCDVVLASLGNEALDPDAIKRAAGSAVRNLGEEGKKKGLTTTLPLALGRLQTRGDIRRVAIDGRLDQQRYRYVRWSPNPLAKSTLSYDDALVGLAERFFAWVGPATIKEFQWFSACTVKAAKAVAESLGLVPMEPGSDRLLLPQHADELAEFTTPMKPQYALVSSLDSISAARRDVATPVDDADRATVEEWTLGQRPGSALVDLTAHAILDRGRLIGYWEFDPDEGRIVWATFSGTSDEALRAAIEETETFVREELGDARSFSLDSPKSRKPRLEALSSWHNHTAPPLCARTKRPSGGSHPDANPTWLSSG